MSILAFLIIAAAAIVIVSSIVWDFVGLWGPTAVSGAVFLTYTFVAGINNMGVADSDINPTYAHMAWAGLILFAVTMILFLVSKRLSTPASIRNAEEA